MPDESTRRIVGQGATDAPLRGVLRPCLFGHQPTERLEAKRCEDSGCERRTREGKPYCEDHVEQHPYVQEVLARRARLQLEVEQALRWGIVDVEGLLARDVVNLVAFRGRMVGSRMAVELGVPTDCLPPVVESLALVGEVTFSVCKSRDGKTILEVQRRSQKT